MPAVHLDQIRLTMNSEFCKCVLGTHVVWIRTFPGTGILESTKIISVLYTDTFKLLNTAGICKCSYLTSHLCGEHIYTFYTFECLPREGTKLNETKT